MTMMMNGMMIGMTMHTMPDRDPSHYHCHVMTMMTWITTRNYHRHDDDDDEWDDDYDDDNENE